MKWNQSKEDYNLKEEVGGELRKAPELSEDLQDLLSTLSGYLPHSYLKFLKTPRILRTFGE